MRAAGMLAVVAAAALAVAAGGTIAVQVERIAATSVPSGGGVGETVPELGEPERVTIPAIGVDAKLVPVGLEKHGAVQTPEFGLAGWYAPGPRPGDRGAAVLLAHVDSKAAGPDVFHRLHELGPGDRVSVHYHDATATFVVTDTEQVAKSALPTKRIWGATKRPVLRLITCGGEFDPVADSYTDNVVVYADRLG